VFCYPDDSILNLRSFWLKAMGDRSDLFKVWEATHTKDLLIMNMVVFVINLFAIWWHSLSLEQFLFITVSMLLLTYSMSYAISLAKSYYINPNLAVFLGIFVVGILMIALMAFSDHIYPSILIVIAAVIAVIGVVSRVLLTRQIQRIDWLLMPRTRSVSLDLSELHRVQGN